MAFQSTLGRPHCSYTQSTPTPQKSTHSQRSSDAGVSGRDAPQHEPNREAPARLFACGVLDSRVSRPRVSSLFRSLKRVLSSSPRRPLRILFALSRSYTLESPVPVYDHSQKNLRVELLTRLCEARAARVSRLGELGRRACPLSTVSSRDSGVRFQHPIWTRYRQFQRALDEKHVSGRLSL